MQQTAVVAAFVDVDVAAAVTGVVVVVVVVVVVTAVVVVASVAFLPAFVGVESVVLLHIVGPAAVAAVVVHVVAAAVAVCARETACHSPPVAFVVAFVPPAIAAVAPHGQVLDLTDCFVKRKYGF